MSNIRKAVVSLAIEQALLERGGKPLLEKIQSALFKEYHSYLPDCYEHPEYLHAVLTKVFGNVSNEMLKSVKKDLEEFKEHEQIAKFLEVISQ